MKKLLLTFVIITAAFSAQAKSLKVDPESAYSFKFDSINEGEEIKLSDYQDKVILVVNTACLCGKVKQIGDMQAIYDEYKDQGLVVIGVPSDDFNQELASAEEIKKFTGKYKRTFPLAATTIVTGEKAHPFYKWAGEKAGKDGLPKWNYHKYLIGRDGKFVTWFGTPTEPTSDEVRKAIEVALAKK